MQTLAYKYRLYPNKVQTAMFEQYFGCTRLLYNQLLAWWKNEYTLAKEQNRKMSNLPLVTYFKQQFPFLNDIDSLALMNTRRHIEIAFREWVCPECGKVIDRDYNAACNLRDWYFMKYNTLGTSEINASGESCQYSDKGTLSGQTVSVKEEATELIRW